MVKIADRATLDEFVRTWRFHHKLTTDQLPFAGHVVRVKWRGMYHGGDMMYDLEGVPGVWHERLLSPADG